MLKTDLKVQIMSNNLQLILRDLAIQIQAQLATIKGLQLNFLPTLKLRKKSKVMTVKTYES